MKSISKKRLFLIMIAAILGGTFGILFVLPDSYIRSFRAQPANEKGCLFCHDGIENINVRMQPFLLAFAQQQYGKREGYECAVCHEGNPSSDTEDGHKGLIPNPSSMWVLHQGER